MADKLVFMVADPDLIVINEVTDNLKAELPEATIYNAVDGAESLKKQRNDPPRIFVTSM